MTMEEAIKHAEEVADSKERQVINGDWEKDSLTERRCKKCAAEQRQLTKWLKELKMYKEQKPCEDLMAIHTQGLDEGIRCAMCTNSMKSDRGCDGGCVVDNVMYKKVMETIANHIVPLVTPIQKWIPISERLPEETGWYLVTFKIYGGGYAVCELSYRKPENYWTDKDVSRKVLSNDEILAWMPKPEGYKGE